jgi:DNA adenine methylase
MTKQQVLAFEDAAPRIRPFRSQLLKWIGNKQRFAHEIASYFPETYGSYFEPFVGSGGVLATLSPRRGFASDCFAPLIEIWQTLKSSPDVLVSWYAKRWRRFVAGDKIEEYERIKASYNRKPNGADLLFLCRACYGGVVRFRQRDGYMSTPCGIHDPISPESFERRAVEWARRLAGTAFDLMEFGEAMKRAKKGDVVYCDPPYSHSQSILYGAQDFSLEKLFESISECKRRGVFVLLSIDGTKRSGSELCDLPTPVDLFEHEVHVNCGRSMLKRFQMNGKTLESEVVADRLLLTYSPN